MWLIALILGLPLIEIALFVTVGAWIGLWATLAVVIGSAIFGIWLIRAQGDRAKRNLRTAFADGRVRAGGIADDVLIVLAGVLLVLPGFFTDACGLLLLLPPVRHALTHYATQRAKARIGARIVTAGWTHASPPARHRPEEVIDATWEELSDTDGKPPAKWTRH